MSKSQYWFCLIKLKKVSQTLFDLAGGWWRMKIRTCQVGDKHICVPMNALCGPAYIRCSRDTLKRPRPTNYKEFMVIKKLLIAAMLAGSLGSVSLPATSAVIVVQRAPPPLRAERAPPPRRGYVWVPGYWDWRSHRHLWVKGTWMRDRPGYTYRQPKWEERDGRWQMERGNWTRSRRDRDGDGVPNRLDNRPNNPNRR
jgi:hypothetical protein